MIAKGLKQGEFSVNKEQRMLSALGEVIYQITVNDGSSLVMNIKQDYSVAVEEIERWQLPNTAGTVEN